jgi:TetR/AcrR family transcriptional regulator, cholesterol catabolism regulator
METKNRILVKSHEQFNRFGIRSVSMDDIAAALGMSKKTLYQHFSDKEELVCACFSQVMEHNQHQCLSDQQRAENPIHELFLAFDMTQEMFANMNPVVIYEMEKYHPSAYKKFQEFKYGFLYKVISNNLERGIREELYRPDIDVDVITRYRIESVMLAFNASIFPNNRTHLIHIEQQLFEQFLYGLATTKGQKLIQKYKTQRLKK